MNRKKEKTEKENRKLSSVCNSINNNSSSNELYIIWQKDKTNKTIQSEDKVLAKKMEIAKLKIKTINKT